MVYTKSLEVIKVMISFKRGRNHRGGFREGANIVEKNVVKKTEELGLLNVLKIRDEKTSRKEDGLPGGRESVGNRKLAEFISWQD